MITNRGLVIAFSSVVVMVVFISFMMVMKGRDTPKSNSFRKESVLSFSIPFSRAIKYDSNEYGDFMKTSQQQLLEIAKLVRSKEITNLPEVAIVSQMIVGKANRDKVYYLDLLTSIQMNLLNPSVSEYHLLQIDNSYDADIMALMYAGTKVKIHYIGETISRALFSEYCNEYLKDRTVVYLNQPDVYFDNTLIYASKVQFGEYVKIHKRISVVKPYDCENGQGVTPDGVIFRTSSQQPLEVSVNEDENEQPIIPMIVQTFENHHKCEIAKLVFGWFLHEPSQLVYHADREKEILAEQERQKKEKEAQKLKEEQERKLKEEQERKLKEEQEMKLKQEQEKKLKEEEQEKKLKEQAEIDRKLKEQLIKSSTENTNTTSTTNGSTLNSDPTSKTL